jgi:hypothetical protein
MKVSLVGATKNGNLKFSCLCSTDNYTLQKFNTLNERMQTNQFVKPATAKKKKKKKKLLGPRRKNYESLKKKNK